VLALALGACTTDPAMLITVHRDDGSAGEANIYVCANGATESDASCEGPIATYGMSSALQRTVGIYTSEAAVTLFFSTGDRCSAADVALTGGEQHATLELSSGAPVFTCEHADACHPRAGCVP
jgi:hypothetical protein